MAAIVAVLGFGACLLPAHPASAEYTVCKNISGGGASSACTDKTDPVTGSNGYLNQAIRILSIVGGVIAVIMISIGGIRYVTSGGDPNAVSSAKNTIIYASIGLVVIILARVIVGVIVKKL